MKKQEMIKYIEYMIDTIKISPELFSDGIDEEILELLDDVKKYIKEN